MFNSFISKAGKKRGLGVHVIYYLVICNYYYLKDDAMKVLHSICQQIWKTQQWPQDRKGWFSFQSQRKAMPKNVQTTGQLYSCHTLAK